MLSNYELVWPDLSTTETHISQKSMQNSKIANCTLDSISQLDNQSISKSDSLSRADSCPAHLVPQSFIKNVVHLGESADVPKVVS